LALVESKHDVSETFNDYLENAQCSVKLPAGSVSPVSITVKFKYLFGIHKNSKYRYGMKKESS